MHTHYAKQLFLYMADGMFYAQETWEVVAHGV